MNSDLGTGTIYRSLAAQVEQFQEELKNIVEKGLFVSKHNKYGRIWMHLYKYEPKVVIFD